MELKPCPFCDSEAHFKIVQKPHEKLSYITTIGCVSCNVQISQIGITGYDSVRYAVNVWNNEKYLVITVNAYKHLVVRK